MGHIRLGVLPQTRKWREVVDLLQADAPVADVASAATLAAKGALLSAAKDPQFLSIVELLAALPQEARGPAFLRAMAERGITQIDTVPALLSGIADSVDEDCLRSGHRSDLGEIALSSLLTTLSDHFDRSLPGLFDPTPAEIRTALGRLASGEKFGAFARGFFARVVDQTLQYYLSRELSNHVGPGQRFASDADRQSFDRALFQHSYEAARIVESYAGGWYGKAVWQGEGLTRDGIRKFTAFSMTKLRGELERRDDAA
ncbi:hypothetical protein [Tropicimonas sp. IMCC6043]|uniref:hypothetical protein n=1 Tax=Tropicimonas sp. IMCC6043 TaxID=2510645 RepID=UPI00101CC795|nr:hypothetical protein [Tropicimonas sp. IMCC6043]RYH08457.1 hypothetical protein EU800_16665 [Tropicimonas sp. IMCC6043]